MIWYLIFAICYLIFVIYLGYSLHNRFLRFNLLRNFCSKAIVFVHQFFLFPITFGTAASERARAIVAAHPAPFSIHFRQALHVVLAHRAKLLGPAFDRHEDRARRRPQQAELEALPGCHRRPARWQSELQVRLVHESRGL